jgi:hypothetical protein
MLALILMCPVRIVNAVLLSWTSLHVLGEVNFREIISTRISRGEESKIEGVVSRWVEVVDIAGSRCHHAMCVDVIASESPIISMVNLTPS